MKLSMMTYTMTRSKDFDFIKMLDLTRELGIDGIDICFVEQLGIPIKELRRMLDDYGIKAICHTFSNDINAQGMSKSLWLDNLKIRIEQSKVLGAPRVMIPTPGNPRLGRAESRRRWIAFLAKGAEIAAKSKITLTVENFPGNTSPFVVSSDMLEAINQVPDLRITYDNGNAASGEDPVESFRRCAKYVVHAHFKDWDIVDRPREGYRKMLDGRYYRPALIGEGRIDHCACIRAMSECGYDGYINIEYEGDKYNPYEGVRRATAYLREFL